MLAEGYDVVVSNANKKANIDPGAPSHDSDDFSVSFP